MRAAVDDAALETVDVLGKVRFNKGAQGATADAHVGRDAAALGTQEVHRKVNPLAYAALGKGRHVDHDGNDATKGAGFRGTCQSRAGQNKTGTLFCLGTGNGATILAQKGDDYVALACSQRVDSIEEDAPSANPLQNAGRGGVAKQAGFQTHKVRRKRGAVKARIASFRRHDSLVTAVLKGQAREAGLSTPMLTTKQDGQAAGWIAHCGLELIDAGSQGELVTNSLLKVLGLPHANALEQCRHGRILACVKAMLKKALEGCLVEVDNRTGVHLDDEAIANQFVEILAGKATRYVDVRRNLHGRK